MDHSGYQALGQNDDPNRQQYGAPPPGPYGQQPPPAGYAQPQGYQGNPYDAQARITPSQSQNPYAPPIAPPPYGGGQEYQQGPPGVAGLTAQLGGMGITDGAMGAPGTVSKTSKKKQRHAFHEIDQAPAAAPTTPFSPGVGPQFGGQFASQAGQIPQQQQQFTPAFHGGVQASSQFPVPANPQFTPANPPTSSAQYNASVSGRPGSAGNSVDPNTIPSIPNARLQAQLLYNSNQYPTLAQHPPPPTTTDFAVVDQGNASPKFARLTMYTVPATSDVLASTSLPLAWILQPLAKQRPDEAPIPVLDFGEQGPPRCRRCRTYINPFMTFIQGGGKFVCNMCSFPNDVAQEYFSPVDMNGRRLDREQRPELIRGVVEYVVPKEYWARPLEKGEVVEDRALRWLFLIDVSAEAQTRGGLSAVVAGIKKALYGDGLSEDAEGSGFQRLASGTKIGIMTYDKEIQYYNLNASLDQAQMLVMPDLEDPFVPLSTGFFVDPYESRNVIEPLLDTLPNLFNQIRSPEPALLPTLFAALDALEKTGGKIICSLSALPTFGPGRLVLREDTKLFGTDKERTLFQAEHQSWRKVANKMVDAGIGIDFFLTPHTYVDNATIGHVSSTTGGDVFFYPNFVEARDSSRLIADMVHTVHRETGYQALMKVRCSNGLQVSGYAGNFYQRTTGGDLEFGVIDADKSMSVSFSYDGKLDPKVDAHFQAALLYTTRGGERRVRCINVVAAVTSDGKEALKYVDQDAVVSLLAKEAASKMVDRPLKEIRGTVINKCVEILAAYRKNFSGPSPPGQLILPEALKEFALFILCLLKCRAIRGGSVSSDMRTHSMRLLKSMPFADLSKYLYPLILPIHNLSEHHGFPEAENPSVLSIPPSIRASFSRIDEGGVYLIDNSQTCILWIHAHVSPNLLADLFGEEVVDKGGLSALDPYLDNLPIVDTHLNVQVRNLVQWIGEGRGGRRLGGLQLARQGLDGAEYEFAGMLMEDRNNEEKSYVDWLVHVHRFVQLEISGQRRADDSGSSSSNYSSPAEAAAAVQAASFAGLRPPYW